MNVSVLCFSLAKIAMRLASFFSSSFLQCNFGIIERCSEAPSFDFAVKEDSNCGYQGFE